MLNEMRAAGWAVSCGGIEQPQAQSAARWGRSPDTRAHAGSPGRRRSELLKGMRAACRGARWLSSQTGGAGATDAPSISAAWTALGLTVVGGGGTALFTWSQEQARLQGFREAGEQPTEEGASIGEFAGSSWRVVAGVGPWPGKDTVLWEQTVTMGSAVSDDGSLRGRWHARALVPRLGPVVGAPLMLAAAAGGGARMRVGVSWPVVGAESSSPAWCLRKRGSVAAFGDGDGRRLAWVLCRAGTDGKCAGKDAGAEVDAAVSDLGRRGYDTRRLWRDHGATKAAVDRA